MNSTVVGSEQGVKKRGRPKVYVTDEQIAEQREKKLKNMREYSKEYNLKHRERKREYERERYKKSREYERERYKKSRELSDDETSEDSDVTFTGDMEYDEHIYCRLGIDIVTVNVSAYNDDL